jgi:hypothetical protein
MGSFVFEINHGVVRKHATEAVDKNAPCARARKVIALAAFRLRLPIGRLQTVVVSNRRVSPKGFLITRDSTDQEKCRESGDQVGPATHAKIPDSPQNNTLFMLGVRLCRLGYKDFSGYRLRVF